MQNGQRYQHRPVQPRSNARYWWTMAAAVATVLVAQAHTIPEPYGHIVSVLGACLAAAAGVGVQRR
jgi:hypothetical protein